MRDTWEMTANLINSNSGKDRLFRSFPAVLSGAISPHQPFLLLGRDVYRTVKCLGPPIFKMPSFGSLLHMSRKEMGVTNNNRFEASEALNCVDCLVIEVRDTVPENVSLGSTN